MRRFDNNDLFSREELAGNVPDVMANGVITWVGAGAGTNNEIQNCALSGVGECRLMDFDTYEPSNLPRSPLFRHGAPWGGEKRYKARELAHRALEISYAPDPVVRYAVSKIEPLGLGALVGSGVVMGAVDSMRVQLLLADWTRLLGIPLVVGGFSGHAGQLAVFPNQTDDEPCLRCVVSSTHAIGISCTTYARAVEVSGRTPATQPLAATIGALMAEAAIRALHREFPMGGKMFQLDIRTGEGRLVSLARDPECPGVHRRFGAIRKLDVRAKDPVGKVLEAAREFMQQPRARLTFPFVLELPCRNCGASLRVARPAWEEIEPPMCPGGCAANPGDPAGALVIHTVGERDEWKNWSCRKLGLAPGAVFELEDGVTGELVAVALAETVDDIFITKRRPARHKSASAGMESSEEAASAATEEE